MASSPVARAWPPTRVDRRCNEAILTLLRQMTEDLALATVDAITVRRLSADGQWLHPICAYHPDPAFRAAIEANAAERRR